MVSLVYRKFFLWILSLAYRLLVHSVFPCRHLCGGREKAREESAEVGVQFQTMRYITYDSTSSVCCTVSCENQDKYPLCANHPRAFFQV